MAHRIPATAVASLIGIKTATLTKWRCAGKGPAGWMRVSATHVTYPCSEVYAFLQARGEAPERMVCARCARERA